MHLMCQFTFMLPCECKLYLSWLGWSADFNLGERKKGLCDLYFVLMFIWATQLFLPHASDRENSAGRIRKSPKNNKSLGRKGEFLSSDVRFIEGFMISLQFNLILNPPQQLAPSPPSHTHTQTRTHTHSLQSSHVRDGAHGKKNSWRIITVQLPSSLHTSMLFLSSIQNLTSHSAGRLEDSQSLDRK